MIVKRILNDNDKVCFSSRGFNESKASCGERSFHKRSIIKGGC